LLQPGISMVEQDLRSAELINIGLGLALGSQLALAGQLLSTLMARGILSREEVIELLNKLADTITISLNQPTTDLQAMTKRPLQDHAKALRKLAADLDLPPVVASKRGKKRKRARRENRPSIGD
jgi:hypothetical protein